MHPKFDCGITAADSFYDGIYSDTLENLDFCRCYLTHEVWHYKVQCAAVRCDWVLWGGMGFSNTLQTGMLDEEEILLTQKSKPIEPNSIIFMRNYKVTNFHW